MSVATRSGTNKFHGEVFDYFRNEALDARNYFNRPYNVATGVPLAAGTGDKAPLKRDNFGVSGGGPIWKDHTFFFGSYEGLRQHQGILQNSTVLSQVATTAVNSQGVTVYSPSQIAAIAAVGSPVATALAAILPAPNNGANFTGFTAGPVQIDQYTGDILHQFSASDSAHAFYAFQHDVRTEPALQGDTIPGWGDHRHAHRQIGTFSETHIFSTALVNEVRLGFNRIAISFNPATLTDPTSIGLGDGLSGPVGLPQITLSDIGLVFGGPSGFPQGRFDTTGVLSDTATWLNGKHTFKFGGEFRRYLVASFTGNIGTLTYTSSITTSTVSAAAALAGTEADLFEKDMATVFSVQPNIVSSRVSADSLGWFAQDNFKVTPRLTLEYGLRFEWNGTPVEGENRFAIFNPGALTLTQVGTNGLPANAEYGQNLNYEPRLGFAYDVFGKGKTVVRGGYAYLVDQPVSGVVTALASNPPFSTAVTYNGAAIPVAHLYADAKLAGLAIYMVNPNYKNAYIESYNLNVQQALPWGLVSSLGYYGSLGRHLEVESNANQVVGATSATQVHPFTTLSVNSPIDESGAIASNIGERTSNSFSDYNAMWAVLSKNMGHGLEFNMNYEWTKSMDLNSLGSQGGLTLPDSTNPKENYGLSDFDVRQHYAGTAVYAPHANGNRLISGYQLSTIIQYQTGNPVNVVAGSSSFNGVTGLPRPTQVGPITRSKKQLGGVANVTLFPNAGLVYGGTDCGITNYTPACVFEIQATQAVTVTNPPNPNPPNPATSAFGASGLTVTYTGLGTMQRNAITGPGFADIDLSGQKDTKIFEGLNFQLRADAFDILNHPNFGQPSGNVQSSTFGQISATRFAISDGGSSRQLQISAKFIF